MADEDSIFTKIIKGEIPCHKVYEDERVIAFLDVNPVHEGHTLVVPKKQVDQYVDLSDEDYLAIWPVVKKLAIRLKEITGKERVGVVIKGTEVPHTHVHLIPFNEGQRLKADDESEREPANQEQLRDIAEKLAL